jgi:hypothetical protein
MTNFLRDFEALDNLMAFTTDSTEMPLIQLLNKVESLYEHLIDMSSSSHKAKNLLLFLVVPVYNPIRQNFNLLVI